MRDRLVLLLHFMGRWRTIVVDVRRHLLHVVLVILDLPLAALLLLLLLVLLVTVVMIVLVEYPRSMSFHAVCRIEFATPALPTRDRIVYRMLRDDMRERVVERRTKKTKIQRERAGVLFWSIISDI